MGIKEKKISIKYILNDRAKPKDKEGVESFPIYIQIVFNRQVSRFPYSVVGKQDNYVTKKEFEEKYREREVIESDLLEAVIRREVKLIGISAFSLKGLPDRIPTYNLYVMMDVIYGYITIRFNDLLSDILSHRQYLLMEANCPLQESAFDNLEFDVFEERAHYVQNLGIDLKSLLPDSFKIEAIAVLIFTYFQFEVKPDLMIPAWLKGDSRSEFSKFIKETYDGRIEKSNPFLIPQGFKVDNVDRLIDTVDKVIFSAIKLKVVDTLG